MQAAIESFVSHYFFANPKVLLALTWIESLSGEVE